MKAIIRWEQLNKKPFSLLDYGNEDDIISLFYVCNQSDGISLSLSEFREGLKETDAKKMIQDFERLTFLASQFQSETKKTKRPADTEPLPPVYIKDIVPMLVMNGLDVYYALNDMELCDLPVFLQAHDQKVKDQLTAQRLWAFMQLSPHLEKGTTPQDIYPFGWEMEENTISDEELEKGKDETLSFLKSGLKV